MKTIRNLLIATFLLSSTAAFSGEFNQDKMMVTSHNVMILSAFDSEDHITAYNEYGTLLWDVAFNPKVVSWKIKEGYLYVLAKHRYLDKTYLTCIDPLTGGILWQRP